MSKIELLDVASGYNLSTINSNFQKVEDELNNKVLYRQVQDGEPNSMSENLDMNGNEVLNASKISSNTLVLGGVQVIPESVAVDPYNGTREALRRSYFEAGYNLVNGSFEAGGILAEHNDVLLHESSGKAYSGPAGTVSSGTDPLVGGFIDVSHSTPAKPQIAALLGSIGGQDSIIFIYGYHIPHDGGGGAFVWDASKSKSEHDGGTVIDPDAVFPTDWDNLTQRDTWFNSSNSGAGCWVRQYDGASTRKMFGYIDNFSMGGDVINDKDFATFSASLTPSDITGYTVSGFTVSGGVATLSTPTAAASLKYPLTLTRNKMYLIKVTVTTTVRGRLHVTLGGVSPYKDNANGYFLTPKLPMLDPDESGQVLSLNVYSFAMLCETIKAGKENIEISVNQVGWTGSVSAVSVQEVEESSFLIAGIAKAEDDALFPTDIVTPTENNPLGLKVGRNWFGCLSVGDRQTGPLYQFGGNAPDDGYGYGGFNLAFGKRALATCTLGMQNTAIGVDCMTYTEGSHNVAVGYGTLKFNTKGQQNTAVGYKSFVSNTIGYNNTGLGMWAGALNQEGDNNTCVGAYTGNTELGNRNTYCGVEAGIINQNGNDNCYFGYQAGYYTSRLLGGYPWMEQVAMGTYSQVNGSGNIAIGARASAGVRGGYATNRPDAISIGRDSNAAGGNSVALGATAKATGQNDVSVGRNSGTTNVTGGNNTFVGNNAGSTTVAGVLNSSALGNSALITGSNQVQLGDSATTTYVYGTVQNRSDGRDKADVRDTALGIEFIMGLRPVDGRWDMRDDYWEEYQVQVGVDDNAEPVFETRRQQLPKDGSKARSRFHHWFIAQEVKELCDQLGVEFGGYQDHSINGGDDVKTLGYDEFIPPTVRAVQQCWTKIESIAADVQACLSSIKVTEERLDKLELQQHGGG